MELTDGKKRSLMMWLMFTHNASEIRFTQDVCSFYIKGERREAHIEVIGVESKGFLCSKNTFAHDLTVQFTPSYISIVGSEKAKEIFNLHKQFITKVKGSGYWEVELPVAKKFINILFYE